MIHPKVSNPKLPMKCGQCGETYDASGGGPMVCLCGDCLRLNRECNLPPGVVRVTLLEIQQRTPDNWRDLVRRVSIEHEPKTVDYAPCGTPDRYGWSCCGHPEACRRKLSEE